jgi:hypothetical protein
VYGAQARWHREHARIEGNAIEYVRISAEGEERSFFFCPRCGATVYYWIDPEHIAVPVGGSPTRTSPRRASRCGRTECTRGSACPNGIEHIG